MFTFELKGRADMLLARSKSSLRGAPLATTDGAGIAASAIATVTTTSSLFIDFPLHRAGLRRTGESIGAAPRA